ncbi:Lrp/AsnC family transcriptional regulator [Psychromicrobium lacuslunae]|uniref:AsnC family transcriptional regulator n=1 Tax=Psychromicrobium lacuslunae TaxID=1618207 RepID=A0A0D4BY94_9MICC|nr:Lrp/AsnC family transcriptional regulator [Psychromicrobium lacuslunae]AJT41289.1 AsnC family transcriptional regulator [Psychromicrobium lacuslunae]
MIDTLDARIVRLYTEEPRTSALEASRQLGVARATLTSRLEKLQASGAIRSWSPSLAPANFGFPVLAFCFLTIEQNRGHDIVVQALVEIPEVMDVHTVSGESDMLVKVAARSNADLQRVLDSIAATEVVVRSSTVLALNTHFEARALPLFETAARA